MSKTHPHKTILIFGVVFCFAVLIVVTGCASNQKKRGIVFRGDWAFEINRTPWVGHPGNTDIPNEEIDGNGKNTENKQAKSLCTKDKKSSLSDSLLGPLSSLKSKCRCKDCMASHGGNAGGGNINITSYNPTIANTFPGPMPGAYPGAIPQGSLSLPPGAIVVPAGVLMPNGTLLPHHLFYSQPNLAASTAGGLQPSGIVSRGGTSTPEAQSPSSEAVPVQPPQMQAPTQAPPQPATLSGTVTAQSPMLHGPIPSQGQYSGLPQAVTPDTQMAMAQNASTQNGMMPNVMSQDGMMQNAMTQNALAQSLNPANPMLINPAYSQVVPGLSMTGTQAPGYPPIGYAPSGYSMGYSQQANAPQIVGPMGAGQQQQSSLAASVSSQGRATGTTVDEDDEEPVLPHQVAAMPYPRHFPVPTRPVYQRNMGMSPHYAAVRPPMTSPYMTQLPAAQGMTSQQQFSRQINQAAAMQEQQMMLERQRQALIMQQNAAVAQSASRQTSKPSGKSASTFLRQTPEIAEDDDAIVAPIPPNSKILLANHQTPILQTPPPRISQVTQTNVTPKAKGKK